MVIKKYSKDCDDEFKLSINVLKGNLINTVRPDNKAIPKTKNIPFLASKLPFQKNILISAEKRIIRKTIVIPVSFSKVLAELLLKEEIDIKRTNK